MFRNQGLVRTDRNNRVVAGYLAFVGGYVNSAGYLLIGTFTSHVTGNVGRFTSDLASNELHAAAAAATMVAAFFAGAFFASMAIESSFFRRPPQAYGAALLGEAALLIAFTLVSRFMTGAHPRIQDGKALFLCAAMGMQNSLVTRLSGAVVRTTHLTGTVTDLGIELARWFRWWRSSLSRRVHISLRTGAKRVGDPLASDSRSRLSRRETSLGPEETSLEPEVLAESLSFGRAPSERPPGAKLLLLATIAGAFTLGGVMGGLVVVRLREVALVLPIVAVLFAAINAFWNGIDRSLVDSRR